jgi:nucleotide-binding universal stress UspA family protein
VKVLFATDGGSHSETAGRLLQRLADPGRVDVEVLTVNGFEFALHRAQEAGHYSADEAQADARRVADEAAAALKHAGFTVDAEAIEGDEATEILRVAAEREVDLIVVGSAKERWVDTVVLGSVSNSVVHASSCPVLVVHEAPDGDGPVKVLIGVDGSEGSDRAVRTFGGFADPARCEVTVLSVASSAPLPPGGAAGAVIDTPDATDRKLEAATVTAERAGDVLRDAGFRVETRAVPGAPARVLLDASTDGGYDLVVVGARGLGRFRAKVLGSVSDRVLRKAPASLIGR